MRRIALLAAVYLVAAKLGLKFALVNEYATAVWPPTGIALSALLLWGFRLWPGVLIGAFLANLTTGAAVTLPSALASAGIATGNTLEALLGAYLVNRFAGGCGVFNRTRDICRFAVLAAGVSATVSATFGVVSLSLAGLARWTEFPAVWSAWWIGDAVGDLVFTPALILWAVDPSLRWSRARAFEGGLLLIALCLLAAVGFTNLLAPGVPAHLGLAFLCMPVLLWPALRFGQRETAGAMLLVSGVAIWGWVHGMVSGDLTPAYVLLELQSYLGVTSVTMLAVAAEVAQRRKDGQALKRSAETLREHIAELDRTEEARLRLAAIVESSDDAVLSKTLDGTIDSWNSGAERIYGYPRSEAIGRPISMLAPPGYEEDIAAIAEQMRGSGQGSHQETRRRRKDGTVIDVALTLSPIRSQTGEITGASVVARDITDRKRIEEQIRQAQKLDSVGVLAGGVAHDFNNLLVGILGNASLALDSLPADHPIRGSLQGVVQSSERAAGLVRQLLAYAGKGQALIEPVRLSDMVRDIARLVQSSIPKRVDLSLDLPNDAASLSGDPSQIQQIVMNLIINAAEAIGDQPGRIQVTVRTRDVDRSYMLGTFGGEDFPSSRYVALEVEDTGCGMDDETRSRIFDPFFTTKFTGRGLGLAAVLGIVRRHKGAVKVASAPGRGARFEVLLPAIDGLPAPPERPTVPMDPLGEGVILVIDDEAMILRTAQAALEHYGYRALLAETGRQGIEIFRHKFAEISLVLLDMTMPVMSGEDVIGYLKEIAPAVPVIVSSGYNEALAAQRFAGKGAAGFIQKPYTASQLAGTIKGILSANQK